MVTAVRKPSTRIQWPKEIFLKKKENRGRGEGGSRGIIDTQHNDLPRIRKSEYWKILSFTHDPMKTSAIFVYF